MSESDSLNQPSRREIFYFIVAMLASVAGYNIVDGFIRENNRSASKQADKLITPEKQVEQLNSQSGLIVLNQSNFEIEQDILPNLTQPPEGIVIMSGKPVDLGRLKETLKNNGELSADLEQIFSTVVLMNAKAVIDGMDWPSQVSNESYSIPISWQDELSTWADKAIAYLVNDNLNPIGKRMLFQSLNQLFAPASLYQKSGEPRLEPKNDYGTWTQAVPTPFEIWIKKLTTDPIARQDQVIVEGLNNYINQTMVAHRRPDDGFLFQPSTDGVIAQPLAVGWTRLFPGSLDRPKPETYPWGKISFVFSPSGFAGIIPTTSRI